ncbi:major vault protein [Sceloporus undulatus]|uniref:major vault protein n=1 Tax=Sceloporus undulatus TaxID=8520 RepID=UPI001C4BF2B8|nr:major vault protein [Sceloporus undulatus]XP_042327568.1 major vault protein [Sceloporus undulatus]XP_042327569.1 major vault protein [Sceloporus undulatus]XP_042327570.1 major vault protein [Sceloporus undulatus]XP_042327571.1 major vault protein [Sceloporus undulatus]
MAAESIIRIPPYYYTHVLDQNSNVTRVEIGPKTYIRQDNERIIFPPVKMVMVPPRHYCIIHNPVIRGADGTIQLDVLGQVRLRHADLEIRLTQDPFPLYPGEELKQGITPLQVVLANTALHLKALLDFEDDKGGKYVTGDEWLFEGPGTYIPQKEVEVVETIQATTIRPNQAIRLQARKECKDREGNKRVTGEEWLVKRVGAYLPGVFEEVVATEDAFILTEKKALHLRATKTFQDFQGIVRKTGEEWLVTMADTEAHIPDVYEEVVCEVNITTLNSHQYCVICDPVDADGKPQLGQKKVVKGEVSFFLRPGEWLEQGIRDVYILSEEEGLLLRALCLLEDVNEDDEKVLRKPGDRWLIRGPLEYVPPTEVEVLEQRHSIPLAENEGIYVRDIKSGKVRAVIGHTYMLSQDEELWEKDLPSHVEGLLTSERNPVVDRSRDATDGSNPVYRDKTRAVSYRVPHNAAVQVYDYKERKSRVVFGPELVLLGPDEQFTVLSLSGGRPKRPHARRALCLLLGPDFCTDIITIETADHARLQLQLAYNWHFEIPAAAEASRLFSVPDFVGDACKTLASRIRGAVAAVTFDDFHKNSNRLICAAVFGFDGEGALRNSLRFAPNGLVISSIDIQSVEPVDQRTRDSLQRSVQLAIEITTNSQEAAARHEAERLEQEARGRLERQKILDQAEAEKARKDLLELEALSTAVESTGAAKAEAQSRAEAARIEGEGAVLQAKLKAEATAIETESELQRLAQAREQELRFSKAQADLDVARAEALAAVEVRKFEAVIKSLGANTIRDIAVAGPEMQAKLLQGLGIQSTLITDGSSPINLFTAAGGLLGIMPKPSEA